MQNKNKYQVHQCYKFKQSTIKGFTLPKFSINNSKGYSINSESSILFTYSKSNVAQNSLVQKLKTFIKNLQDKLNVPEDQKVTLNDEADFEKLEKMLLNPAINICYSYENQNDFIASKNSSQNLENQFIEQITHLEKRNKQLVQTIEKLMSKDEQSMELVRVLSIHYFASHINKFPLDDRDFQEISNIRNALLELITQFNYYKKFNQY